MFEGDTIYSESEVLEVRESPLAARGRHRHRRTTGSNQDGVVVITFRRTIMVYRRGHGPAGNRPRPASAARWTRPVT